LKVGRGGARLHPRWGAFATFEGSKRWRDRLLGSGSARRGGTPLPFGLKLGSDLFGCGLLRHRALGGGAFGGSPVGRRLLRQPALGGGSLCCCAFRSGTLRSELRCSALSERTLRFGTPLRGGPFRLGAFLRSALRGGLLRCGAELFLRTSLLGRATLLDRALHRSALQGGTSLFFRAPLR
jgi:hypothetical protein